MNNKLLNRVATNAKHIVKAKFTCTNIQTAGTQMIGDKEVWGKAYSFQAVMVKKDEDGNVIGNEENSIFGMYTPAGSMTMTVYNDNVKFEVGKEYYLDFTPAE